MLKCVVPPAIHEAGNKGPIEIFPNIHGERFNEWFRGSYEISAYQHLVSVYQHTIFTTRRMIYPCGVIAILFRETDTTERGE